MIIKKIKKQKIILIVIFTLTISAVFLPSTSYAFSGWEMLKDAVLGIGNGFFALLFTILLFLANGLAHIAGALLNWIIGPNFISLSYTNPAHNPIIKAGFDITRNLVNMGIVFALVVIALSVALRVKEYATEKTLIRLIAVALLVNFAPLLCGVIVDASNIIMNYFLSGIHNGVTGSLNDFSVLGVASELLSASSAKELISLVTRASILVSLNIAIAFAFFLYSLVLVLRYITIWTLVILSPLAFVAFILPSTKKWWDQWWQQLIHWSFVGIPMAFFLWLSIGAMSTVRGVFYNQASFPGIDPATSSTLDMAFPYFVVLVFIYLGFTLGLQTSATGAGSIINWTKKKGAAQGMKTWKATKTGVKNTGAKIGEAAKTKIQEKIANNDRIRRLGESWSMKKKWGENEPGAKGFFKRLTRRFVSAPIYYPYHWGKKSVGNLIGGQSKESVDKKINKAEKATAGTDVRAKIRAYRNAWTDAERIGILNSMIKEGQIDDAMDSKQFKQPIKEAEINRLVVKRGKRIDFSKNIKKAFPHSADKYISDNELNKAKAADPNIKEKVDVVISKMKPNDYESISKKVLSDDKTIDAMLKFSMPAHINTLFKKFGSTAANVFEKRINAGAPMSKKMKDYFTSSAAKGLISPKTPPDQWNIINTVNTTQQTTTNTQVNQNNSRNKKIFGRRITDKNPKGRIIRKSRFVKGRRPSNKTP